METGHTCLPYHKRHHAHFQGMPIGWQHLYTFCFEGHTELLSEADYNLWLCFHFESMFQYHPDCVLCLYPNRHTQLIYTPDRDYHCYSICLIMRKKDIQKPLNLSVPMLIKGWICRMIRWILKIFKQLILQRLSLHRNNKLGLRYILYKLCQAFFYFLSKKNIYAFLHICSKWTFFLSKWHCCPAAFAFIFAAIFADSFAVSFAALLLASATAFFAVRFASFFHACTCLIFLLFAAIVCFLKSSAPLDAVPIAGLDSS